MNSDHTDVIPVESFVEKVIFGAVPNKMQLESIIYKKNNLKAATIFMVERIFYVRISLQSTKSLKMIWSSHAKLHRSEHEYFFYAHFL